MREDVLVRLVLARDCLAGFGSGSGGGGIGLRAVLVTNPFPGFLIVEVRVELKESRESVESPWKNNS